MSKIKAAPFRLLRGKNGRNFYFETETLRLFELEPEHLKILRVLEEPHTIDEILLNREIGIYTSYVDEMLKDGVLEEIGAKAPVPRAYRLVLTECCNLACAECFATKGCKTEKTMPLSTLMQVITDSIDNSDGEPITYHFFGGEPLVQFSAIRLAVERIEQAVLRGEIAEPVFAITTNATLMTDEIIRFFKKHNFKVGVSVDGNRETHDVLRPYFDGTGTYDDVMFWYRKMVQARVDVHVLMTPNPGFLDNFVEMAEDVLQKFPMKSITINTPFKYDTLEWSVDGRRFAEILFKVERLAKLKGVTVTSALSPVVAAIATEAKRTSACSIVGDEFMASVSPSGELSFCSQKWSEDLSLEKRVEKINSPVCDCCSARNICGGVCRAFQILSGKLRDENKCNFMHRAIELLVENLDLFEGSEEDDY